MKVPPPYQPIKYFVSSLNTFFANHLVARLRNDSLHPENPNRIVGTTIKNNNHQVPAGVRKVIDVHFPNLDLKSNFFRRGYSQL